MWPCPESQEEPRREQCAGCICKEGLVWWREEQGESLSPGFLGVEPAGRQEGDFTQEDCSFQLP